MSDNPKQNKSNQENQLSAIVQASYSSPLPPASELQKYNQTYPQAAEIIFDAFKAETEHRHQLENKQQALDKQI